MPQLPALEINPRNALLDVSGVTNALQGLTDQRNKDRDYAMDRERLNMARQSHKQSMANSARAWKRQDVEAMGRQAQFIDSLPDTDPRKSALWSGLTKRHGAEGLTPEEMDFRTGPKLMMAQAGLFKDPAEANQQALDNEYKRAQINALNRKQEPDPVDQFILQRLQRSGSMPAPQQPQPQAPSLQPQSFDGAQDPNIKLIADQTAIPQQQAAPGDDLVDTPYGRMPRDEAQSLGGTMLLSPKYSSAGRAILDSVSKGSDVGMSKPAANQLDERTISAASTLGRLQDIKAQFKPEFQQIPDRLKLMGASWGASMGGKLSPEMQRQLSEFSSFKATAFDNFNQLLKELSGTAVSAQELSRQKIVQPNPGEGIFDGDDPVSFMSKVAQGERIAKSAVARMNYMRSRGLQFNKDTAEQFMRLEDVPEAIERRGAELEQQMRQSNPKADPMTIEKNVKARLKQEFGI